MLRKISSVMIFVNDLAEATNFYSDVFGLKPIWEDQNNGQAGLLFPESDAEVILHTNPNMPGKIEIFYLVDNVSTALEKYIEQGCTVLSEPFDLRLGKGAVIQDPFGTQLCILDTSRAKAEIEQI